MKTIHHVVDVPARASAVWEALTTEQGLSGWWSTQVDTSGADVGAVIRFRFLTQFNPEIPGLTDGHRSIGSASIRTVAPDSRQRPARSRSSSLAAASSP